MQVSACAVLQPAVAEAARRVGAAAVGLVDLALGPDPTANTELDRVLTTYSDGRVLGDPAAALRLTCRVVGGRVPPTPVPRVVARTLLDRTALEGLPQAVDQVPAEALPVVLTTWALSRLRPSGRERFLELLRAVDRPLAWVSVEGVGVAPTVPTLGDRPASGHSIVGLAVLDGAGPPPQAVGRCWSRGRVLAWFGGPSARDPVSSL